MKIRLSEDEVYEIKMPEEIGVNDFQSIVLKFNFLLKNFAKFHIGESENKDGDIVLQPNIFKERKKHDKEKWIFLKSKENRNAVVELLNTHYNKSKEEFFAVGKKYNVDITKSDMATSQFILVKEMHKIKPSEFGLIKFPSRYEQISNLRIKENGENKNE